MNAQRLRTIVRTIPLGCTFLTDKRKREKHYRSRNRRTRPPPYYTARARRRTDENYKQKPTKKLSQINSSDIFRMLFLHYVLESTTGQIFRLLGSVAFYLEEHSLSPAETNERTGNKRIQHRQVPPRRTNAFSINPRLLHHPRKR